MAAEGLSDNDCESFQACLEVYTLFQGEIVFCVRHSLGGPIHTYTVVLRDPGLIGGA